MAFKDTNPELIDGYSLLKTTPDFGSPKDAFYVDGIDGRLVFTPTSMSKHLLFAGNIGTGKTTAMFNVLDQIVPSMTLNDVMVVFDTKGDFKKKYYRPGKDAVISYDKDATVFWNIFREVTIDGKEKIEENLMEIVNAFFSEKIKKSNAPFFPQAARDVLYGIISYIIYKNDIADIDNAELRAYLDDANINDVIDALTSYGDLRGIIDYIYSGGEEMSQQTQGVYSEVRTVARELLVGNFCKSGNFSVREFVRNKGGRILFIEYDLGIGSVLTPVYKVLMDLAIKEQLSRSKSEGNVYFVIDEFKLLPGLNHIDDGINFGRSLGAKFIVAIQNVQQIIEAYGQEKAFSILSSFGTVIAFRVTNKATKDFIQEMHGKNRKRYEIKSRSYSEGKRDDIVNANVVEDWDIFGLGIGEAIVLASEFSHIPFKFTFKE